MVAITKLLTDGENPIRVIISEKMRPTYLVSLKTHRYIVTTVGANKLFILLIN